LYYLHLY